MHNGIVLWGSSTIAIIILGLWWLWLFQGVSEVHSFPKSRVFAKAIRCGVLDKAMPLICKFGMWSFFSKRNIWRFETISIVMICDDSANNVHDAESLSFIDVIPYNRIIIIHTDGCCIYINHPQCFRYIWIVLIFFVELKKQPNSLVFIPTLPRIACTSFKRPDVSLGFQRFQRMLATHAATGRVRCGSNYEYWTQLPKGSRQNLVTCLVVIVMSS